MATIRIPRSRGPHKAPARLRWDQVQLTPIVLIRVGEGVFADRAVRSLLAQAKAKDPTTEIMRLEAATYEPHQLGTLAPSSLFGEPRLVYVPVPEQMTDALLSDLIAYVGAVDPETNVILRHNGGQQGKRLLGAIRASPYPIIQCEVVKSAKDKSSLIVADIRRVGRSVAPEAVGTLVGALDSDLCELCSAVDQLLTDTQGTISVDHVRTYYAGHIEATGFVVADAAAAGNTPAAITALHHAVATGTDPAAIVAVLAMKVRQLARVAAAGGRRMSPAELGMAPWQVDRVRHELQGWSDDILATSILVVVRTDAEAKGVSRDSIHAVKWAVLATCNARRLGSRRR